MYNKKFISKAFSFFKLIFSLFLLCLFFLRPETAISGVLNGLGLCAERLIPSLFPFLIISGLIMSSPLSSYGGILITPFARLLKIKSKKAATGLLLGFLGGFAGMGSLTSALYKEGEINKSEAEILICAGAAASPAFTINTVGYGMLGSSAAGLMLYISIFFASLTTGFIMSRILPKTEKSLSVGKSAKALSVYEIIQNAVASMLSLCGFVVFFSFTCAVLQPEKALPLYRFFISSICEVTLGCAAASALGANKIYFVCGALSVLGLCAVLQLQAFCKKDISLLPFIFSRVIHVPLSLLYLRLILNFFPYPLSVYSAERPSAYFRLPADTFLAFFLLMVAFFCDFKALPYLRGKKNKV